MCPCYEFDVCSILKLIETTEERFEVVSIISVRSKTHRVKSILCRRIEENSHNTENVHEWFEKKCECSVENKRSILSE